MAYKCIKSEWKNASQDYECEFICDSEDDIQNLPQCSAGSIAIVVASGMPTYMMNASGQWVKI